MRPATIAIALLALTTSGPFWARPAAAQPTFENGQVTIGSEMTGPDLEAGEEVDGRLLVAIDSPYQVFNDTGTMIHVAAWTPTGTPARGARVYLSGHLVGLADETGTIVFRWGVPGNDVEDYWTHGSNIDVRWDHDGQTFGGQVWFSALARTSSFESDHLFVYTDRGTYNPGQTVHIRSIAWHLQADWAPLEGAAIEYLLNDPSRRVVAAAQVETDDFGTASVDFALPQHADEGMYELVAQYEGATASTRLRVERFQPPVIDIDHTLGRFLTRDQDALSFDVELGYFTGGEFRQGQVAIDVLVDGASRYREEREVSGRGPHHFEVTGDDLADIRRDLVEDQRVEVRIAALDEDGRQDEVKRELRYTANPYIAVIEKDRDYYSEGDAIELIVRLTDRERVPVRDTEVTLTTSRGGRLTHTTDEHGTAQFTMRMGDESFSVEVYLADVDVPLATAHLPLQPPQPMRSHIADAIVEENRPAHVRVTFPSTFEPAESVVHMDVVDSSGSLVNAVTVPIRFEDGHYLGEGTFTAPSWGSMLLTFFCLGRDSSDTSEAEEGGTRLGLLTEGQNLAVHPGRELTIHLDGIGDELPPGSDFSGRVVVRDAEGNPVDASVGVSVVDQAVISLKDPLEITPMDHFYNPELRVISSTGSAILTWPVVSRNWGARTHDVALPPFPYLPGGPIAATPTRMAAGEGGVMLEEPEGAGALGAPPPEPEPAVVADMLMATDEAVEEEQADMDGYAMGGEVMRRSRRHGPGDEAPPPPVIIIRTEFPETALWEPQLLASGEDGAEISGTMPDSITLQQISVVASDRRGGVGVLRHSVRVTQPLFVRSDLPDTLTVGDRVEARVAVQNFGEATRQVTVSLTSEGIEVAGGPQAIEVEPGGTSVAVFSVVAPRAGEQHYVASARDAELEDRAERDIWVRPAGTPEVTSWTGSPVAGSPFVQTVEVPAGGQLTTVVLNVAFPSVSAAFAGLEAVQNELTGADIVSMGGELISAGLLYRYQLERRAPWEQTRRLKSQLEVGLIELLSAQRPDGGWGFWWDAESQPYVTGYCLEALILLRELDFEVPTEALSRAVDFLASSRHGITYDFEAIGFWEGNTEAVALGLTAEIFAILASVPDEARTPAWHSLVDSLAGLFEEYLTSETPEVMAYAHALLGLHRLAEAGVHPVERERLVTAANRLNTLRREGHWEPSWFNAYGGTIEATVAVIEVHQALGEALPEADAREAVRYLLSTRDEWGGWHNPRGTAEAIRGLLLLQPPGEEGTAIVTVRVDGAEVRRVTVGSDEEGVSADPFLQAAELRYVDLSDQMGPGTHQVEVTYDGSVAPSALLTLRHWGERPPEGPAIVSLDASVSADRAEVGEVVSYQLVVSSTSSQAELVYVDVAAPSNAEIIRPSVQRLEERGLVDGYEWTDKGLRLRLFLEAEGSRELSLDWVATRPGEAVVPAATARVVRPGPAVVAPGVAMLDRPLRVE